MFFKPKKKLLLALDIGASSVKAVVFWSAAGGKPELLNVFRTESKLLPEANFSVLYKEITASVKEITSRIHKSVPHKIEAVFVSLSSPWYFSQTRIIKAEQRESFKITQSFADKAMRSEEDKIKEESCARFNVGVAELNVLEKRHLRSFLNGYPVSNIFDKTVKSAALYVYMSVVLKKMIEDVSETVRERLGVEKTHFHTSPAILFDSLRKEFGAEPEFLLIDIGEEITDVVFARNGYIEEVASFARGSNFVVRRLASFFKVAPEEALSYLRMLERGELSADAAKKADVIIKEAAREWRTFLQRTFEHFYKIAAVSDNAYLLGSPLIIKPFAEELSSAELAKFVVTAQPMRSTILTPAVVYDKFRAAKSLSSPEDVIAAFLALFFNKHVWQKTENI